MARLDEEALDALSGEVDDAVQDTLATFIRREVGGDDREAATDAFGAIVAGATGALARILWIAKPEDHGPAEVLAAMNEAIGPFLERLAEGGLYEETAH